MSNIVPEQRPVFAWFYAPETKNHCHRRRVLSWVYKTHQGAATGEAYPVLLDKRTGRCEPYLKFAPDRSGNAEGDALFLGISFGDSDAGKARHNAKRRYEKEQAAVVKAAAEKRAAAEAEIKAAEAKAAEEAAREQEAAQAAEAQIAERKSILANADKVMQKAKSLTGIGGE
ncbi:hypothetical protein H9Y04_06550 [Streptomyces sp. TRM66268-LWL]|uniref:Uncharacterized protein n=1 Tax=Streptomyces polyasparticus TaxID=2767826 RepID=A0ABR7S9S0_9ACTN|nr:hypothetical protein [Streptomyces polyasparticus]MBC9712231.1 hypothetical protein [Streptomyces polyasparticus]